MGIVDVVETAEIIKIVVILLVETSLLFNRSAHSAGPGYVYKLR